MNWGATSRALVVTILFVGIMWLRFRVAPDAATINLWSKLPSDTSWHVEVPLQADAVCGSVVAEAGGDFRECSWQIPDPMRWWRKAEMDQAGNMNQPVEEARVEGRLGGTSFPCGNLPSPPGCLP